MSLVKTSLNAVTADAIGSVLSFDTPRKDCGAWVIVSGSPATGTIFFEGSIDGTNYAIIGNVTVSPNNVAFIQGPGILVQHLRAQLTGFSGTATVTVIVAGTAS